MAAQIHRSVSSRPTSNFSSTSAPKALTTSQVGRIVNSNFKEGQVVKGNSRINYMPYEKKVVQYQNRKVVKKVPIKKKVIEYQQRKYIEKVPRQVVKTGYYPTQRLRDLSKDNLPMRSSSPTPVSYVSIEKQYSSQSTNFQPSKNKEAPTVMKPPVRAEQEYNLMMTKHSKQTVKKEEKREMRYMSTSPSPARKSSSNHKGKISISYKNENSNMKSQQNPYQLR